MLFDINNLFYHTGSAYAFTSGEYASLSGVTASTGSLVINMGAAEDLGIGDGEFIPKVAVYVGAGITSACASLTVNVQFQGSTDSSNWTTYAESGALSTASFVANNAVLPIDVPRRPPGVSLPQYYRLNLALAAQGSTAISSGTLIGGIVIQRADSAGTLDQYGSGYTAA